MGIFYYCRFFLVIFLMILDSLHFISVAQCPTLTVAVLESGDFTQQEIDWIKSVVAKVTQRRCLLLQIPADQ